MHLPQWKTFLEVALPRLWCVYAAFVLCGSWSWPTVVSRRTLEIGCGTCTDLGYAAAAACELNAETSVPGDLDSCCLASWSTCTPLRCEQRLWPPLVPPLGRNDCHPTYWSCKPGGRAILWRGQDEPLLSLCQSCLYSVWCVWVLFRELAGELGLLSGWSALFFTAPPPAPAFGGDFYVLCIARRGLWRGQGSPTVLLTWALSAANTCKRVWIRLLGSSRLSAPGWHRSGRREWGVSKCPPNF